MMLINLHRQPKIELGIRSVNAESKQHLHAMPRSRHCCRDDWRHNKKVSGISTGRRHFHRYRNSFHQGDELNLNVRDALRHQGVQKNQAILRSQFTVGIPFECLKMQRRHQPPMSVFTDNGRDLSSAGLSSFLLKHYVTRSYYWKTGISRST